MPVELYQAPPGSGKTHWAVQQALQGSRQLATRPIVCVQNALQRRDWQRRIAQQGGAIGVQVLTFQGLARLCLAKVGQIPDVLDDTLQYRLLRALLARLDLSYYASIQTQPGFAIELLRLLSELERAMITPEELASAAGSFKEQSIHEIALIYRVYQQDLAALKKIDSSMLAWQAAKTVSTLESPLGDLLIVDGLTDYDRVQACLLQAVSPHVQRMIVLLDGEPIQTEQGRIGSPLIEDRELLTTWLNVPPKPLPLQPSAGPFNIFQTQLFSSVQASPVSGLEMLAAPNAESEIREALRWLKARIVLDNVAPEDTALVLRSLGDRIPLIEQVAQEFELPIRIEQGRPLEQNPCIAILLMLLEALVPLDNEAMTLLPRELIEILASPYMDFQHAMANDDAPIGWLLQDTCQLDRIAREGVVIQGLSQWREALEKAITSSSSELDDEADESHRSFGNVQSLHTRFERLIMRLLPPEKATYRDWVGWLEELIGDETESPDEQSSLGIARLIAQDPRHIERDRGALLALKDILRALVQAEHTLGASPLDYVSFFEELHAAIQAATYLPESRGLESAIQVLSAPLCRGLSFSAVALVGLAEGEFPQTLRDDILLPEAVRHTLRQKGLLLRQPLRNTEQALLYQMTACARDKLLCTRPRLTAEGAEWAPSPYWEELARFCATPPRQMTSSSTPLWEECASWEETVLAASRGKLEWSDIELKRRLQHVQTSADILHSRSAGFQGDEYDGYLADLAEPLQGGFNSETVWSPTRLEHYAACPYWFFVAHVLKLEPREEPQLGPDARQLGSLLHRILEQTYALALAKDDLSIDNLIACLNTICEKELAQAPLVEGFRETAWWKETRYQLRETLERSVRALETDGTWRVTALESRFSGRTPITAMVEGQEIQIYLRGIIDRVDYNERNEVRIIDYKTGGASSYTDKRLETGELLQMPLYALAAEQILKLGKVRDGFYWHILATKASPLNLANYDKKHSEPAAITAMRYAWQAIEGIMTGQFVPSPPSGGCPTYCPAAGFCSHFRQRYES